MHCLAIFATIIGLSACGNNDTDQTLPVPGVSGPGGSSWQLSVDLGGRYIRGLQITPEGFQSAAAGAEVTITFQTTGLAQVRQFELVVELDPASAFTLDGAVFLPQQPFITPFASGIELESDGALRLGGASLGSTVTGDRVLGKLTLKTSSRLNNFSNASVRVRLISIGPSSQDRERYEGDQLPLGVRLN